MDWHANKIPRDTTGQEAFQTNGFRGPPMFAAVELLATAESSLSVRGSWKILTCRVGVIERLGALILSISQVWSEYVYVVGDINGTVR